MASRTGIAAHHSEWLALVETSGPFLTLPVLTRAFPNGLDEVPPELARTVAGAYDQWQADPTLHGVWARWVLTDVLGFDDRVLVEGQAVPATLTHRVPEHGETLRPDLAVLDPPGSQTAGRPRLLVTVWPSGTPLDEQVEGSFWAASPNDRMAELLRAKDGRAGLVTNGERWVLVNTGRDVSAGFATWDAALWLDDRITLAAFRSLLSARRFFGVDPADTLERLLDDSANAQQEVTDQLGFQVRRAVELLVEAFSRANRESGGELLAAVAPETLYGAAVAVMMRLVFLLSAEERGLFLLGDELYDESYAVSTLRAQLQAEADRFGEEPLEKRATAWHRLLATFRMVHAGVQHEDLRLPAYGGSLFDPERHPFLEGRQQGERWQDHPARPLPIDDRTVLHLLSALQVLSRKGQAAQRLSYRALDVEQIGHVYEGLLDHTAVRVDSEALGLEGRKEPEVALSEFEATRDRGIGPFVAWLADLTGRTPKALEKALATRIDPSGWSRLLAACGGSTVLTEQLAPYHALLRRDLRGLPVVYLPQSIYVTAGQERRGSGTYYTPRALAEEVVKHTLDPLIYNPGPAEGADPADWKLKPVDQLLDLKICDMAMGSGAFLVAACRYLAARVVESWTQAKAGGELPTSPGGQPLPDDPEDWELHARRLVADRCLYGVDKNPMAVEMAKLSVWLVTLAKGRPFEFLDHGLRCGDSLLGIASLDQLTSFHPNPALGRERQLLESYAGDAIREAADRAAALRRQLESFPVLDVRDAEEKARLLAQAERTTEAVRIAADVMVGAALSATSDDVLEGRLFDIAPTVGQALDPGAHENDRAVAMSDLKRQAEQWLRMGKPALQPDRRCFHWPLDFPEVSDGFQAIVGNPPFQGGQKITGALGTDYREWLVRHLADSRRGSADLVAYFFLRASQLIARHGGMGLLATNTIAQGDTREVGLDHLTATDWIITQAVKSRPWPGDASLEVAQVWLHEGAWSGPSILDGTSVHAIAPSLDPKGRAKGKPQRLRANSRTAFLGSNILGMGFFLTLEERNRLIQHDPRNAEVLFPHLSGEDLNTSPNQSPSRWVINFFDWPLERAQTYPECLAIVRRLVKPEREANNYSSRARECWWQYERGRTELYELIAPLDKVIAIARVSKTVMPISVPTGPVFNEKICVFVRDDPEFLGLLSSAFHYWWAIRNSSTLRVDLNYAPTDCFETFPQPDFNRSIGSTAQRIDHHRQGLMSERREGLTKTYNRVHNPSEQALDIEGLRRLHVELDHTVAAAYGWDDLPLDHDFYETRQGTRFTVSPATRTEMLDRLLELNHERYAEEVRLGLHDKPGRGGKRRPGPRKLARPDPGQTSLLE